MVRLLVLGEGCERISPDLVTGSLAQWSPKEVPYVQA